MRTTGDHSVIEHDEQAENVISGGNAAPKRSGTKPKGKKTPAATNAKADTKAATVLKLLRSRRGASRAQLVEATGWQAHSARGFLPGTVKKKLGLAVVREVGKDGTALPHRRERGGRLICHDDRSKAGTGCHRARRPPAR